MSSSKIGNLQRIKGINQPSTDDRTMGADQQVTVILGALAKHLASTSKQDPSPRTAQNDDLSKPPRIPDTAPAWRGGRSRIARSGVALACTGSHTERRTVESRTAMRRIQSPRERQSMAHETLLGTPTSCRPSH